MSRKLNTFVHVVERDEHGNTGRSGIFGPDDQVPEWAAKAITNPAVWADGGQFAIPDDQPAGPTPDAGGSGGGGSSVERPRGNASRADWAAYAAGLTPPVSVADQMSRDDIVAAVDQRS